MLNIPGLENDDFIKQKLYIFTGVFMFEFIVSLISTVASQCIVDLGKIAKNSLLTALLATIAYSVYNDLIWSSNPWIADLNDSSTQNLAIAVLIIVFIAMGYFIDMLFTGISPNMNDCINTIYPSNTADNKNS